MKSRKPASAPQDRERRKRSRLEEDEKHWRAQLAWTCLVGIGVLAVALQQAIRAPSRPLPDPLSETRVEAQTGREPGRFLSSSFEPRFEQGHGESQP